MSDRQLLYRGLSLITLILILFVLLITKIKGGETPVLGFSEIILSFIMFLFATLWRRNLALLLGIFFYSIHFNIELFKNEITGWDKGHDLANNLWTLGLVCSALN